MFAFVKKSSYLCGMEKETYIELANLMETEREAENSPIRFCHRFVSDLKDCEIAGLLSSWLGYGYGKVWNGALVSLIEDTMGSKPYEYVMSGEWNAFFENFHCLHRMNTFDNLYNLCSKLRNVYSKYGSIEDAVLEKASKARRKGWTYGDSLCSLFSGGTLIQPASASSMDARMERYARWMTRGGSPFDVGMWGGADRSRLVVFGSERNITAAKTIGLISSSSQGRETIMEMARKASDIFEGDPARMDFALMAYSEIVDYGKDKGKFGIRG